MDQLMGSKISLRHHIFVSSTTVTCIRSFRRGAVVSMELHARQIELKNLSQGLACLRYLFSSASSYTSSRFTNTSNNFTGSNRWALKLCLTKNCAFMDNNHSNMSTDDNIKILSTLKGSHCSTWGEFTSNPGEFASNTLHSKFRNPSR